MPKHQMTVGSRIQVWNGTAKKTSGGLTKGDLKYNAKSGRIVSVKASRRAMSSSNPLRQRGLLGAIGLLEAGGFVATRGGPRRTPLPGKGKMARMARKQYTGRMSRMSGMAGMSSTMSSMSRKKKSSPKKKRVSPAMAALRRSMRMMA